MRHDPGQDGDAEERELRPRVEGVSGLQADDDEPRRREQVRRQNGSAEQDSAAQDRRADGGAHGRGPAAGQQRVADEDAGDEDGGRARPDAEEAGECPQKGSDDDEVLPRNGEDVDDAGADVFRPLVRRHRGTLAEQQRARQPPRTGVVGEAFVE